MSRGELPVGTFYFFLAAVNLFMWPVRMMGRILTELGKALVAIGRIYEILAEKREQDAVAGRGDVSVADTASVVVPAVGVAPSTASAAVPGVGVAPSTASVAMPGVGVASSAASMAVPDVGDASSAAPEVVVRASVTGSVSAAAALPVAAHIALEDADGVDGRAGGEPVFRGSIEFEHVDFAHGASPVLHDVTFRVRAGETLALVGPSGSGKSTIVNLLLRFYDPDAGCVLLDDVDLGTFPRKHVRGAIAVVMQEPFLYSKTLRDNIRFGRPEARVDEIVAAAEAAHVHGSIEAFEAGYETMVGERGVMLSGGQRQRVALARALLDRPAVLVLDDALSAVDTETESLILENLRARQGQQTTILIAHRISTLMHADHILVLEHGRIVERGTHAELVAGRGLYRRLWEIQTNLEDDLARDLETATA
ncbi:MAG: ATP-binding cassette domain-containing protein, partial [Candidatus Eisenbacteria bacterium]|nr:ATP-binding cassette domain-containing protein [Candidatus Eisenbacteria bacterium]